MITRNARGVYVIMIIVPLCCAGLTFAALRVRGGTVSVGPSEEVRAFRALPPDRQKRLIALHDQISRDPYAGRRMMKRARDFLKRPADERRRLDAIDAELRNLFGRQTDAERATTAGLSPAARGVKLIRDLERNAPQRFNALRP